MRFGLSPSPRGDRGDRGDSGTPDHIRQTGGRSSSHHLRTYVRSKAGEGLKCFLDVAAQRRSWENR
jgi:uncharacterized protein (UPF0548 family)